MNKMIEIKTKNESETECCSETDRCYESNSSDSECSYLCNDDRSSADDDDDGDDEKLSYPPPSQLLLPDFPSLNVSSTINSMNDKDNFPINSRVPIPIETDLFVGEMLLIIRPSNPEKDDPYWNSKVFKKKKRRIVIQIQGKLKHKPKGVLYAGAEISKQMELGFVARGMSSILLNLVKKFCKTVHYSFGDDKDDEKPHIVVPAYNIFDRFIVTKENEQLPKLGEPFIESTESISARRNSKDTMSIWNTEDTYSISFYSMYIDIASWSIVNLPLYGDINFHTFWGNSLLRIVMYENRNNDDDATTTKEDEKGKRRKEKNNQILHLQKDNNYAIFLQIKHSP